jgi:hypothetical protein
MTGRPVGKRERIERIGSQPRAGAFLGAWSTLRRMPAKSSRP